MSQTRFTPRTKLSKTSINRKKPSFFKSIFISVFMIALAVAAWTLGGDLLAQKSPKSPVKAHIIAPQPQPQPSSDESAASSAQIDSLDMDIQKLSDDIKRLSKDIQKQQEQKQELFDKIISTQQAHQNALQRATAQAASDMINQISLDDNSAKMSASNERLILREQGEQAKSVAKSLNGSLTREDSNAGALPSATIATNEISLDGGSAGADGDGNSAKTAATNEISGVADFLSSGLNYRYDGSQASEILFVDGLDSAWRQIASTPGTTPAEQTTTTAPTTPTAPITPATPTSEIHQTSAINSDKISATNEISFDSKTTAAAPIAPAEQTAPTAVTNEIRQTSAIIDTTNEISLVDTKLSEKTTENTATTTKKPSTKTAAKPRLITLAYKHKPYLVIIIDDIASTRHTNLVKSTHLPLTPSIFPPTSAHPNTPMLARDFDVFMVHLPLEAMKFSGEEEGTLHAGDSYERIYGALAAIKRDFAGLRFYNNHTGSKFTSDEPSMRHLLDASRKLGLYFVDSKTIASSKAPQLRAQAGELYMSRDVFLDNENNEAYVRAQLKHAMKVAHKKGYAIAIGHPRPSTINAIKSTDFSSVKIIKINELYELLQRQMSAQ